MDLKIIKTEKKEDATSIFQCPFYVFVSVNQRLFKQKSKLNKCKETERGLMTNMLNFVFDLFWFHIAIITIQGWDTIHQPYKTISQNSDLIE